jgi:hypothetical protein
MVGWVDPVINRDHSRFTEPVEKRDNDGLPLGKVGNVSIFHWLPVGGAPGTGVRVWTDHISTLRTVTAHLSRLVQFSVGV